MQLSMNKKGVNNCLKFIANKEKSPSELITGEVVEEMAFFRKNVYDRCL